MNTYIVKARGGISVKVCSDDILDAGRDFKRQRRDEEIVSIRLASNTSKPCTVVIDGTKVNIPVGYYRVRRGKTRAGDLAWWDDRGLEVLMVSIL